MSVVVSDVLLASPRNTIVMLHNTDNIHHSSLCTEHGIYFSISGRLVNACECEELVGAVKGVTGVSHVLLVIGARGEVASPVRGVIVSVGEHVIVLGGPLDFLSGNSIDVDGGCRVDELDVGELKHVLVPVVDHRVRAGEEFMRILEVEVATHRDEDVV